MREISSSDLMRVIGPLVAFRTELKRAGVEDRDLIYVKPEVLELVAELLKRGKAPDGHVSPTPLRGSVGTILERALIGQISPEINDQNFRGSASLDGLEVFRMPCKCVEERANGYDASHTVDEIEWAIGGDKRRLRLANTPSLIAWLADDWGMDSQVVALGGSWTGLDDDVTRYGAVSRDSEGRFSLAASAGPWPCREFGFLVRADES